MIEWRWWMWPLLEVTAGLIIALLLRRFVCLLCLVKGRSMQDTLQNGEVVFALRREVHGENRRFDVVLCKYPNRKGLFVKQTSVLFLVLVKYTCKNRTPALKSVAPEF